MDDLIKKSHNFETAKNSLKEFAEQAEEGLELKQVNDKKDIDEWFFDAILGGGVGVDHKVSGAELNELILQLQAHFKNINEAQIKLIKEFGVVYNALDSLDNDYIQYILNFLNEIDEINRQMEAVAAEREQTRSMLQKFNQKLKYAYWLAGGSIVLVLVELMIILLK